MLIPVFGLCVLGYTALHASKRGSLEESDSLGTTTVPELQLLVPSEVSSPVVPPGSYCYVSVTFWMLLKVLQASSSQMKPTLSVRPVPVLIFHVCIFYITCLCTFLIARTDGICCVGTWGLLDLQQLLRKGHSLHSHLQLPLVVLCNWGTLASCYRLHVPADGAQGSQLLQREQNRCWRCRSNIFLFHVLLIFALCYTSPIREGTCMLKVAQVRHFTRSKRSACVKF